MSAVVIVGQGPRSIEHPDDAEVWVINGPRTPPRWDRLFQLHGVDHIHQVDTDGKIWALMTAATKEPGRRLVMYPGAASTEGLGHAEAYPLHEILMGRGNRQYLTGSFALAIALAVHEGFTEIDLDGVQFFGTLDHWGPGEAWAVPCIEYHIGRAEALGIMVDVPEGSGLFRHADFVYGFTGPGSV